MKKILQRLCIFFLGIPAVVGLVVLLPYRHYLASNLAVILVTMLGAVEFSKILSKRGYTLPLFEVLILSALVPASLTFHFCFGAPLSAMVLIFMAGFLWVVASAAFASQAKLPIMIDRTVAAFSIILYPGLFMIWISFMTILPKADILIIVFLLMIFCNDSLAWAMGLAFGKNNRGYIPASPNKSIVGFAGGILASVFVGVIAWFVFPAIFSSDRIPGFASILLLSFATGIAGIVGDLAESAFKRSAAIKDSGTIMLGRGGILDSIDSIAFAAPVFYGLYILLYRI